MGHRPPSSWFVLFLSRRLGVTAGASLLRRTGNSRRVVIALGGGGSAMKARRNPRYANGSLRRKHRARLKAIGGECGICRGRLGEIHYDEPSDAQHPLSFVVDEIKPVSRWREFGYPSPEAAANDWGNLQAAHYICNLRKSNKTPEDDKRIRIHTNAIDGAW